MKRDTVKIFEDFINKADSMNARINADTEAYRKGDAKISVTSDGKPVKSATIIFSQKNHEFKFGANCFMLDELETEEKNEIYKSAFKKVFNLATIPFYWNTLEAEKGKPRYAKDSPKVYRRPAPDLCLEFCEKNGITPKLHCLNYDSFVPEWYAEAPLEVQKVLLEERFRSISERYADKIPDIEVANEFYWERKARSEMYRWEKNIEWSFKLAEKYFPNNSLIINEGPNNIWWLANRNITSQGYYLLIKDAIANGARIDKIGMQYHIWTYNPDVYKNTRIIFDPDCLFDVMDTYAKLADELQVTEITLPAYGDALDDEDYQAQVLEKLYRIWFSHKNMQAAIYWNLIDGYAHGATPGDMTRGENIYYGGLLRFDGTPKKAYNKLIELTQKEWHSEGETHTDDGGYATLRGFYGDYEVKIIANGKETAKTVSLSKYSDNNINIKL